MSVTDLLSSIDIIASRQLALSKSGVIKGISGCFVNATGLNIRIGSSAYICIGDKMEECEVIGGNLNDYLLLPSNGVEGISIGDRVEFSNSEPVTRIFPNSFGCVLNGFGEIIDGNSELTKDNAVYRPIYPEKESISDRGLVNTKMVTNSLIFDSLLTFGEGQKIGVFAGSGVGKSTLINKLYSNIDMQIKIVVLVGERSREVVEFKELHCKNNETGKTIIIASTSEDSPYLKRRSVYTGLAYAKYFSDMGFKVLLFVDSITRLAHSLREIGISRGEAPVARGYPPSVFSELPKIVEQCGAYKKRGNISVIFSILVDGDDTNDPVSDFMRGVLDAHIVLTRELANKGLYPAVEVLSSRSRVKDYLLNQGELKFESLIRKVLSDFSSVKDVIESGLYQSGTSKKIDALIPLKDATDKAIHSWDAKVSSQLMESLVEYDKNF